MTLRFVLTGAALFAAHSSIAATDPYISCLGDAARAPEVKQLSSKLWLLDPGDMPRDRVSSARVAVPPGPAARRGIAEWIAARRECWRLTIEPRRAQIPADAYTLLENSEGAVHRTMGSLASGALTFGEANGRLASIRKHSAETAALLLVQHNAQRETEAQRAAAAKAVEQRAADARAEEQIRADEAAHSQQLAEERWQAEARREAAAQQLAEERRQAEVRREAAAQQTQAAYSTCVAAASARQQAEAQRQTAAAISNIGRTIPVTPVSDYGAYMNPAANCINLLR